MQKYYISCNIDTSQFKQIFSVKNHSKYNEKMTLIVLVAQRCLLSISKHLPESNNTSKNYNNTLFFFWANDEPSFIRLVFNPHNALYFTLYKSLILYRVKYSSFCSSLLVSTQSCTPGPSCSQSWLQLHSSIILT